MRFTIKKLKPYWELMQEKRMRFNFQPPFSTELNHIEVC